MSSRCLAPAIPGTPPSSRRRRPPPRRAQVWRYEGANTLAFYLRRRDGLPWLGWLPEIGEANEETGVAMAALQQVLRSRWRVLLAA